MCHSANISENNLKFAQNDVLQRFKNKHIFMFPLKRCGLIPPVVRLFHTIFSFKKLSAGK